MANRRRFLVEITMAAGAVTYLRPFKTFAQINDPQQRGYTNTFTLLHTANLNGQWQPFRQGEKLHGLGGVQHLIEQLRQIKNEAPSAVLIHAGNIANTRLMAKESCLSLYKLLNQANYDAIVPGTADLTRGKRYYLHLANESGLPVCTSKASTDTPSMPPYKVVNKGNYSVGIINAAALTHKSIAQAVQALDKTALQLRTFDQCILIVCILPAEGNRSATYAKRCTGIDVMLNSAEKKSVHNVEIMRNHTGREVILSYAGSNGTMVSRMDLTFNERQERTGFASRPLFVGAIGQSTAAIMKKYNIHYA